MNPMFRLILYAEGLGDWEIAEGEAYCWIESKTIKIPKRTRLSSFLHEVAHALNPHPEGPCENHYHGPRWAATYGRLVNKYMTVKNADAWRAFLNKEKAVRAKTLATRRVPVETKNTTLGRLIGKYYGGTWFTVYGRLVNQYLCLNGKDYATYPAAFPAAATELGRKFGIMVEW